MIQPNLPLRSEVTTNRFAYYTAILTTMVAIVTFAIAIFTPPLSGPLCAEGCLEYPFTDISSRFPRDYFWMYPAIVLMVLYVILMVCIHQQTAEENKLFSQLGLSFSLLSAVVLLIDYFVQVAVIQPSLVNNETEGIALVTQYNSHGIFIALEELGYLLMSFSFFCVVPVFSRTSQPGRSLRWVFITGFLLTLASFIIISLVYGIHREYLFEIVIITIDYIILIVGGILLSKIFKREIPAFR
ncbi:hypothetical protein GXP67_07965 [Rhodocytophaga rosea]|uniref:DUF998 domain-containing protein n=1 Tax=Rhodocytophaga rosea TaxID=2704465 RepID=A0A6C0GF51_9BACT|nr:hypothetical protein [Rhodocytophaga rosea]QHT66596.1 hypothetical protein GXP67_07965 [Rhodocytophaga rosea]